MVLLMAVRGRCCCHYMTVRGDALLLVMQVSKKNIGAAAGSALSSGKDSVMDVLVMENVLYAANTTRIYDLKGSERSRWSPEDPTQAGAVLMDDNLRENNLTQPILVRLPLAFCVCILYAVFTPMSTMSAISDQFTVYPCSSAPAAQVYQLKKARAEPLVLDRMYLVTA